jgi:hypothetical protein
MEVLTQAVVVRQVVYALDRATTVFQECAVSGIFAVGFIGFYIAARCVESVLAHGAKVKREE